MAVSAIPSTSASSSSSPPLLFRFPRRRIPRQFRLRRRKSTAIRVRSQFSSDDILHGFLSHLPHSLNSLNSLALTALSFASGLALSLPNLNLTPRGPRFGEWILFTSPTPFNRFVLLRCPSISFDGAELLENVNEKLVKEERHYVRLDSGRIPTQFGDGDGSELDYSRVCVATDDGGVIALDWPSNLDLNEEHGLDSTVLLIPGSTEGSSEQNVKDFVRQCLNRGLFPVVMNPRGCAGSPLTTSRLFTAADSDDVSSAIQFLSRTRPWSTFMAVGWGFGANMLTKYLVEVGEKTPLTAAACIDNPFDLEEVTKTSDSRDAVDQKLTGGLKNILKSNKGLFQGRSKGFDVEKALSAKSVRDFDTAISMISHGFETIEEFYSKSSSRLMVGNIKVPVLFIQSDDGSVPLFSIPREDIADNLFTSLLICSSLPSNNASTKSVIMWSQELTIEWLMAVELAFLKGRHPLLTDVDVTINPSKGLAIAEGWISDSAEEHDTVFNLQRELGGSNNGNLLKPLMKDMLQDDYDSGTQLVARKGTYELQDGDCKQVNGVLPQSGSVNAELDKPESTDAVEGDKGQVLQTAKVVMNILDVTMPGTLTEEKKKKVLTALDQGETLIKAFEGAVPEDVRGKLTSSVSEILQTQGKNLNFDVLSTGLANMSSQFKVKINGNQQKKPDDGSGDMSTHSSEPMSSRHDSSDYSSNKKTSVDKNFGESDDIVLSREKSVNESSDSSSSNKASADKRSGESDDIVLSQEKSVNDSSDSSSNKKASVDKDSGESDDIVPSQEKSVIDSSDSSSNNKASVDKNSGESDDIVQPQKKSVNDSSDSSSNNKVSADKSSGEGDDIVLLQEKSVTSLNSDESQSTISMSSVRKEADELQNKHDSNESTMENDAPISQSDGNGHAASTTSVSQQENPPGFEEVMIKSQDSLKDKNEAGVPINVSEGNLQSNQKSPDSQPLEKQDNETKNADERSVPLNLDQNKPSSDTKAPTFNVTQALDALTGLDDSTQVAVNSVFGVLEEMINQLEEKKEDGHTEKEGNVENAKDGNGPQEVRSSLDIQFVDKNENHSGVLQNNTSDVSDEESDKLVGRKPESKYPKINDLYLFKANRAYAEAVYNGYLQKLFESNIKRGDKHLGLDTNSSLFLDYVPEEGQWKLLEEPGSNKDEFMESSCPILDSDKKREPIKDYELSRDVLRRRSTTRLDDLTQIVKNIVLDSLHVEVSRKLIGIDAKEMETSVVRDMEEVANAVAMAVRHDTEHHWCLSSDADCTLEQGSGFDGAHIIETISSAVKNTNYLKRMVPVGVAVGSSLASLRKFFNVASVHHECQSEALNLDEDDMESMKPKSQLVAKEVAEVFAPGGDELCLSKPPMIPSIESKPTVVERVEKKDEKSNSDGVLSRDTVMVGAVTAALGASALFQEYKETNETGTRFETPSNSLEKMKYPNKNHAVKFEEATDDKHQNMVISLAEKAMSVAAPVMPTKQDGEVDQERLVAMLAELGQKGGILKLFGKLALLWGGIRGALSLTNKLIGFLLIADRPLIQRLLAFGCMVLILWSPVAVPFLPTLVQNWMTKSSSGIAELVCTFGLYIAVAVLIVLWGKRIRGYENPLRQYGLDWTSSENAQDLLIGLIGGIMLVLSIHSINAFLGFVDLSWPLSLISSPVDHTMKFQSWIKLVFLAGQGVVTAIAIASLEELFFRSWLAEEIAIDLGDHRGILLSGLAFSICQSSLLAIPGLWLLSLSLAGERQRKQGSLYSPIGLRAGIMASCFVLQKGGFLIYRPNLPLWMTGTHPFQPFSGIVGLVFSLLLALVLYPRHLNRAKEMYVTIQE